MTKVMANASEFKELLRTLVRQSKAQIVDSLLVSLVTNLLALATPVFVMQIYDRVVVHKGIATLEGMIFVMIFIIVFDGLLRYARAKLFQRLGLVVDVHLGRAVYQKLLRLPLLTLESRSVAGWQMVFRDVETIRTTLAGPTMITLLDLPFAFIFMAVIAFLSYQLTLILIFILGIFITLAWWSGRSIANLTTIERNQNLNRDTLLNELLVGRNTVKALAMSDVLRPRFETVHARSIKAAIDRGSSSDAHQVYVMSISLSATITLSCIGALMIINHDLSMGTLVAVNMLSSRLVSPLAGLVGQWKAYQSFRQSLERLEEFFAIPTERADADLPLQRPQGAVTLEQMSFRYRKDGPLALDGLSGSIGPGGIHCLVGSNGAGKSTLLKLLAGLYLPQTGRILLDGADIAQFSRKDLAVWVGYMPQETSLFAGTIRENILAGDSQGTEQTMLKCAKAVGAHEAIIDLPDGYDTMLAEGGAGLSSGQRRRIAMARALMRDPPVLLLDEPTADVDQEAEEIFIAGLKRISLDHTIIISTHSMNLLMIADSVLVMDHGRVTLAGAARDVMTSILREREAKSRASAMPMTPPPPLDRRQG